MQPSYIMNPACHLMGKQSFFCSCVSKFQDKTSKTKTKTSTLKTNTKTKTLTFKIKKTS